MMEESKDSTPKKKKKALETNAAIPLAFPPLTADPTSNLAPLRDDQSGYAVVTKTCLHLTSYAGTGSSVQVEDTTSVSSSALFHDPSYSRIISASCEALIECIQEHKDRRCRILACKTLGILARSAYARIRPTPLLFGIREPTITQLEDQVGTDIPAALATAALDDTDDGVSATAVEALGIMTLSSSHTVGTLVEDELLREMEAIAFCRVTPYAPTLRAVVDEDPSIPQAELQSRIYENIMGPRLLQMVDRIMQYRSTVHINMTLPCLTACLVHQVKTTPPLLFGMDRPTYAKRWVELDAVGLIDTVVQSLLLPSLQSAQDGSLAQAAALSSLRLAHVCPNQPWVPEVVQFAVTVFKEQLLIPQPLENKMGLISAMIIALRAVPLPERTETLILLVDAVKPLPATTHAPHGVTSPGALVEWQGYSSYRRPARVGFWTEMALSFFMDGTAKDSDVAFPRRESLNKFLTCPSIVQIIGANEPGVMIARDEILLAFTSVASCTGKRFRMAADGTAQMTDTGTKEVKEWLKLAWVILTTFLPCAQMGTKIAYLDEDLSLLTAGQASYVRLLQEYLHFVGYLQPESSVALKLTANACPPHIIWDQMTDSAAFLSRFESDDMGELENTTKLMSEIVKREVKHGIPSHHMRLFLLALAADNWVQGRVSGIRKQFEAASSTASSVLKLDMQAGREILAALGPKRLLAKIFDAHIPPVDKKKKDPIKKLAFEAAKVSVACIENIGLIACDWRRRFGSTQETKHLVSVAVGLLQGKIDETPINDTMKSIMGPICEAAVARIQAFYESQSSGAMDQSFPASELIQQTKTKIKPLVSSSSLPSVNKDEFLLGYLTQLSRQLISSRVEQSIQSAPSDSVLSATRPPDWLRLTAPPVSESRDARTSGVHGDALAAWGNSVSSSSASSDAATFLVAYTPRRYLRYDGEEEFRLAVLMRVFNITAVDFEDGLRLEFGIAEKAFDPDDHVSKDIIASLGGQEGLIKIESRASSAVVYRQEIKAGECLTWEAALNHSARANGAFLVPSIVFRNLAAEPDSTGTKWVGEKTGVQGDASVSTGGDSKAGEDDFQVTKGDSGANAFRGEGDKSETENLVLPGEPLFLSPLVGLQPCPLVFFRDCWGDIDTFRFLWFRMSYQLPPLSLLVNSDFQEKDTMAIKIGTMSCLTWEGEAIPGGYATKVWAFMTQSGSRLLAVFAESDADSANTSSKFSLHFRGDDNRVLCRIAGSKAARGAVVAALMPGMTPLG